MGAAVKRVHGKRLPEFRGVNLIEGFTSGATSGVPFVRYWYQRTATCPSRPHGDTN